MSNPFVESRKLAFDRQLATSAEREPAAQVAARYDSFERFLKQGLPTSRLERWKYTSLRALEQRRFGSDAADDRTDGELSLDELPGCSGPRLVFVNGRYSATLSRVATLPAGVALRLDASVADANANAELASFSDAANSVTALNAALASCSVQLQIGAGIRLLEPLLVVHLGLARSEDVAAHSQLALRLEEGAEASLVEHCIGHCAHSNLTTRTLVLEVGSGARLRYVRLQDESESATLLCRTEARVSGLLEATELCLGAALSRHELAVELFDPARHVAARLGALMQIGHGAKPTFNSRGVFALRSRQHADFQLDIEHKTGNSSSDVLWRGIAAGRARGVFKGAITIQRGADGSAAKLSNKNLLLSEHAEIDTQPVLEIFADEVQASHGATVGQLDERALFYLRSRGIALDEARTMLTYAFCREALGAVEPQVLRDYLTQRLLTQLPRNSAVEVETPGVPS